MVRQSATATAPAVESVTAAADTGVVEEISEAVEIPKSLSTGRPAAPNPRQAFVKALAADRAHARSLVLTAESEDKLLLLVKSVSNDLNRAAEAIGVTVKKRTESNGKNSAKLYAWAIDRQKRTRKPAVEAAPVSE